MKLTLGSVVLTASFLAATTANAFDIGFKKPKDELANSPLVCKFDKELNTIAVFNKADNRRIVSMQPAYGVSPESQVLASTASVHQKAAYDYFAPVVREEKVIAGHGVLHHSNNKTANRAAMGFVADFQKQTCEVGAFGNGFLAKANQDTVPMDADLKARDWKQFAPTVK